MSEWSVQAPSLVQFYAEALSICHASANPVPTRNHIIEGIVEEGVCAARCCQPPAPNINNNKQYEKILSLSFIGDSNTEHYCIYQSTNATPTHTFKRAHIAKANELCNMTISRLSQHRATWTGASSTSSCCSNWCVSSVLNTNTCTHAHTLQTNSLSPCSYKNARTRTHARTYLYTYIRHVHTHTCKIKWFSNLSSSWRGHLRWYFQHKQLLKQLVCLFSALTRQRNGSALTLIGNISLYTRKYKLITK